MSSSSAAAAVADASAPQERPPRVKGKHKKDKPWDSDAIDHWTETPFTQADMPAPLLEESSFSVLFPAYREKYLAEAWPSLRTAFKPHGLLATLDLVKGSMTVRTTRKTWDPYAIVRARDVLRLLARSVPLEQALKGMRDDIFCDIIQIGAMVRNKERFVKRRQRLVGPNGATLKAVELLTGCYVLVQGNTVASMGPHKGLKAVRRIVEDCMNNIHPVYHIKTLMIKRELAKDPALKDENWDRFLPKFEKSKMVKSKEKVEKPKEKKPYTPFPPSQLPRKVDMMIESGEYFMSEKEKRERKERARDAQREERERERKEEREAGFHAPESDMHESHLGRQEQSETRGDSVDDLVAKLQGKTKSKSKDKSKAEEEDHMEATDKKEKKEKKEKSKKRDRDEKSESVDEPRHSKKRRQ